MTQRCRTLCRSVPARWERSVAAQSQSEPFLNSLPLLAKKTAEDMQVSHTHELEGGRRHYSIGRIKASCSWRAVNAHGDEADRLAAIQALIREAQEYDADAIVGLDFEVDGVKRADFDGTHLQRIAATGIAVKFAEAA
jgi:Putative heavy-metal-binding